MSFFTSLRYYRPCSPPEVTADDLSRLVALLQDSEMLTDAGVRSLSVKFGDSIDQDDVGIVWEEEIAPGIAVVRGPDWDLELTGNPTVSEIIQSLASDSRHVCRASISLGSPVEAILRTITREPTAQNQIAYRPDGLSINIGPIECFDLGSEQPVQMGWISLDLSGYGYLYPWTLREVVERLKRSRETRRLTEICRSFWPVPPELPEPRIAELRQEFSDLWPYDRFDEPWDWFWGVQETG